jgi:hypothetical protein
LHTAQKEQPFAVVLLPEPIAVLQDALCRFDLKPVLDLQEIPASTQASTQRPEELPEQKEACFLKPE